MPLDSSAQTCSSVSVNAEPPSLILHSPAKVNFALRVGSARPGDGYHPIASWMVAIDFRDTLTLCKQASSLQKQHAPTCDAENPCENEPDERCDLEIAFANDAPVTQPIDWPLEKDLAYRAWQLVQEQAGRSLPIHTTLSKRIPAGAGLAGGSGNAAAMIVGLNKLFALNLPESEQMKLAMRLGCDVAFLLAAMTGQTSALVTGVGDELEILPPAPPQPMVLVLPPFGCPTGAVYQAFDQLHAHQAQNADATRVRTLATQLPIDPSKLFNDLAIPAWTVQPKLAQALEQLSTQLSQPVHVTGSGAAMFILTDTTEQAADIAEQVHRQTGLAAISTQTMANV